MKLDRHGIRFNIWLFFFLFAIMILLLIGVLQYSMVKPYYRNSKIQTVKRVAEQIQEYMIDSNITDSGDISNAFQVTVDNNVCVVIYNESGNLIYDADSLGSGCVFHDSSQIDEGDFTDSAYLKTLLIDNNGEYSQNFANRRTNQDMILYGRTVKGNLGNYYMFVSSPTEPVDSIIRFFSSQYVLYTIIAVIAASLVSIYMSRMITKPIVDMKKSADRLAKADYSVNFDGGSFTETKELASTLNDARTKISRIDELRKDLIANVSHDIKTPLTNIKAYAEMIKDISGNNPVKREQHLNVIIKETDYLNHLVTDMSELSKMQSGNYELNLENFDLSQKIRDIVELNQVMIDEDKVTVIIEAPETMTCYADEIKIGQVIYNFLSNALKHTPENHRIWIRALSKDENETIRVEVQDEGEGIAKEDLPLIWNRYQKASRSFCRSKDSTGLGLAIVKAILDTHHAEYGVQSELGQGSLFWFELRQTHEA